MFHKVGGGIWTSGKKCHPPYEKSKISKKVAPNIFLNLSKTQNPARSSFLALSERFDKVYLVKNEDEILEIVKINLCRNLITARRKISITFFVGGFRSSPVAF